MDTVTTTATTTTVDKERTTTVIKSIVDKIVIPKILLRSKGCDVGNADDTNATTLDSLENINCVTELYDDLLSLDQQQGVDGNDAGYHDRKNKMENQILRLRLLPTTANTTEQGTTTRPQQHETSAMMIEAADYYRAVIVISKFLLLDAVLPKTRTESSGARHGVEKNLHRATTLLHILEELYLQNVVVLVRKNNDGDNNPSRATLPTNYPDLLKGMERLKNDEEKDLLSSQLAESNNNLLESIDRQQLIADEQELLRMANAPIPTPDPSSHKLTTNKRKRMQSQLPQGFLKLDNDSTIRRVEMNELGIIRACCQQASSDGSNSSCSSQWWAITSTSSITFDASSNITISSCCCAKGSSNLKTTTLTLDVGEDGNVWWEYVSKIVNQLKELRDIQDDIIKHWPEEDYLQARSRAFRETLRAYD